MKTSELIGRAICIVACIALIGVVIWANHEIRMGCIEFLVSLIFIKYSLYCIIFCLTYKDC